MSDNFIYGYCRQYNCTMSTEFCEKYRRQPSLDFYNNSGRNNLKCAGCGAAETGTADPKPSNKIADILKKAASLDKRLTDAANQAYQEAYGDSVPPEPVPCDETDRQMAMVIPFKVLDCLCLIMGDKAGDLNRD